MGRENIQQTLRLLMLDAFAKSDPDITAAISRLATFCPSLLNSLLPKSQQQGFLDDNEFAVDIFGDRTHHSPAAQGFLSTKSCNESSLPLRADKADPVFKRSLSQAYHHDYQSQSIHTFGNARLKWCKKFSYNDR